MMGHSAAVLFALATMAVTTDTEVTSFAHNQLAAGQKFEIRTQDRTFRGRVVDRVTGECQMSASNDGVSFSPERTVFLLGGTAGRQDQQMLVLMHEVKVGLKLELGMGDLDQRHRYITTEVQSIRLGE